MKRAARHKTGSVVFDRRRKTWNFLWWEDGKRRSKSIGAVGQHPTKASAWRAVEAYQESLVKEVNVINNGTTVNTLVQHYRAEKMPKRADTRRAYEVWLKNHILPRWGESPLTELQARPVELWLDSLSSQKQGSHTRLVEHSMGLRNLAW